MKHRLHPTLIAALLAALPAAPSAFAQGQDSEPLPSVLVSAEAPTHVRRALEEEQARTPGAVTILA
ncbi:hypothetical protein FPK53_30135, partial [Acinetobacter baumannii]|nr:hypothetical protein [Acinetobacter baumannii]